MPNFDTKGVRKPPKEGFLTPYIQKAFNYSLR